MVIDAIESVALRKGTHESAKAKLMSFQSKQHWRTIIAMTALSRTTATIPMNKMKTHTASVGEGEFRNGVRSNPPSIIAYT